ncbi:MAG: DinB family protein [Microscillaceae bacterium]|nr:DinB family protein [Microscillaceae bacterium]
MNIQILIREQLESVDRWTLNLVDGIPGSFWKINPPTIDTNLNWQIGHILVSKYFHAIACINGPMPELNQNLPISEYMSLYNVGSQSNTHLEIKPNKERLLYDLNLINQLAIRFINDLSEENLNLKTELPNPVAETKYDSLMWTFKHQMWHNGQIALLKKLLKDQNNGI